MYNTELEIGVAIKKSGIPRSQLYVTTKVITNITNIAAGLDASLKKLDLEYVNLYLIHAPFFAKTKEELQTAWQCMEAVQKTGKAKSIGVSNFMQPQLETILEIATVVPAVNQLEYHPYLQRENLVPWSESKGIVTAAYGPLSPITKAKPGPLDPVFEKLMQKYKVGEEAVALRWCIQMGVAAVTTTGRKERLKTYLGCLDFELSKEEVEEISRVGRTKHFRVYNWGHDYGDSKE